MNRTAFLDRDGTLIWEPGPDHATPYQVSSLDDLRLLPRVLSGLRTLADAGFGLVMVTNQDGLGTEANPTETFEAVNAKLFETLASEGLAFADVRVCPHLPEDDCACRKPRTGMIDGLAYNPAASVMVGDRDSDLAFAENLGVAGYRVTDYPDWAALAAAIVADTLGRTATVTRRTAETQITLTLALDGEGRYEGSVEHGFLSHLLHLFAAHSRMDLTIEATGDGVDDHHLIEDVGLVLGQALREALGDKRGLRRYGDALVPMDEVLCAAAVDLSGRFAFETDYAPVRDMVGELSTEMVPHLFHSLAVEAKMALHLRLLNPGRNEHHRIEAMTKAFARALRVAVEADPRAAGTVPSTKGSL
ncbi:MAG: histidinol-phosphatase [Rhodothermaceae bacterium]|nr:histidinol-phosphatase [Rhodothermaceae bacterium]